MIAINPNTTLAEKVQQCFPELNEKRGIGCWHTARQLLKEHGNQGEI